MLRVNASLILAEENHGLTKLEKEWGAISKEAYSMHIVPRVAEHLKSHLRLYF